METQDMCSVSVCKRKGRRKEVSRRWRKGRVGSCEHTSLLFCTALKCSFLRASSALFQWAPNMRRCLSSGGSSTKWERERIWKKLEREINSWWQVQIGNKRKRVFPVLWIELLLLLAVTGIATRQVPLTSTVSRSLLMSTESVVRSDRLILCRPLLLSLSVFPGIRIFSTASGLHIRYPKYWIFSFSIQ